SGNSVDTTIALDALKNSYPRYAIAPAASKMVRATDSGWALYNLATGKQLVTWLAARPKELTAQISADGKTVAIAQLMRKGITILDGNTLTLRGPVIGSNEIISVFALSPDGAFVASCGLKNPFIIWDTATATPRAILRGHDCMIADIAFAPDSKIV